MVGFWTFRPVSCHLWVPGICALDLLWSSQKQIWAECWPISSTTTPHSAARKAPGALQEFPRMGLVHEDPASLPQEKAPSHSPAAGPPHRASLRHIAMLASTLVCAALAPCASHPSAFFFCHTPQQGGHRKCPSTVHQHPAHHRLCTDA